ncbi:MAG: hypothetical protein ACLU9T_20250 [Blautia faecis]
MSKYRYTSAVFDRWGKKGLYLAFTSVHEVMLHDAESVEPEELKTILEATIEKQLRKRMCLPDIFIIMI